MTEALTLTPEEAIALVRPGSGLPSFISDVKVDDGTASAHADLRRLVDAPVAVKAAAKVVPTLNASAAVKDVTDGVATFDLKADAAGLPVSKLLGLAQPIVKGLLKEKGLPTDVVSLGAGTFSVNLATVLADRVKDVTGVRLDGGKVIVEGTPA
ncbi:hypothetical protein [Myceligenerans xiligouense]|uniref:Uncharacterized protein n=1 Tax=Myceligenerans xiligouense TaxID=253184 RepID=A0A3N4YPC2_9MICO|nr:hypothetical protein [Myceligenerans xiligouense]RPF22463.1 hypothetical protein EDD34_3125 [Myceligenerans xiligouense]